EERFISEASSLEDLLEQPNIFKDRISKTLLDSMLEQSARYNSPIELLEKAKNVDNLFGTNLSSRVFEQEREKLEQLPLEELIEHPILSSEWLELFNNSIEQIREEYDWQDEFNVNNDLLGLKDILGNNYVSRELQNEILKTVTDLMQKADSEERLTEIVEFAKDNKLKFSSKIVKEKGQELGISPEKIARLIGTVYEYLRELISNENISYERTNALLERANLSTKQLKTLATLAVEKGREGALGALATKNLVPVASCIPNTDAGKTLFEQALGAGGGENLLMQWFASGQKLPAWQREIVKNASKRVMIDLAKARASSLIGSSEAGPLPEGTTRPYVLGDDPDSIDLDETLEHILDMGKNASNINIDDFIVRKTVTGRRCVIFLVDISGSMEGAPLASSSLATAMLLVAFSRDELGVALFESSTHVMCRIDEPIDVDEVVDKILELEAMGGTQMQAALQWAEDEFHKTRTQDKMLVMVTDAMIGDFQMAEENLRHVADLGVTCVLVVPQTAYGLGNIQSIVEAANAQIVPVSNWKKFPEIVSKILSRT
ncbi:MAG: vWA domain-containing protein, partial [Candidatus Heimdallarchaeaceae archaeon]